MSRRREVDFAESSRWRGEWWDPRYPDERLPGELTYSPGSGISLEFFNTDGDVNDHFKRPADHRFYKPLIHGYANSTPATLIEANLWNSGDSMSPSEGRTYLEYEYKAEGLVLGAHMEDPTARVISHPTFGVEQAAHWPGDRPLTDGDGKIDQWRVGGNSYSAPLGDHTLQLSSWLPSRSSGDTGLGIQDETVLSRSFMITGPPMSYRELMEKQRLVLHLLSLATGIAPKLTYSQAAIAPTEKSVQEPVDFTIPSAHLVQPIPLSRNQADRSRRVYELVFTLEDVDFQELIPKWLELNDTLGGALRILIGNRYLERPVLESLLLSIVAAAEAMHSKLELDPPIDPETFKSVKKEILAGTPEEYQNRISNAFMNRHSLRQHFEGLMKRLPQELMRFSWTTRGTWMKIAREARNDISHSGSTNVDGQDLYDTYKEIEELLLINVLYELGVPAQRINDWVANSHQRTLQPRWYRPRQIH